MAAQRGTRGRTKVATSAAAGSLGFGLSWRAGVHALLCSWSARWPLLPVREFFWICTEALLNKYAASDRKEDKSGKQSPEIPSLYTCCVYAASNSRKMSSFF